VNCGLWSSEVYETVDGSLINVPQVAYMFKIFSEIYGTEITHDPLLFSVAQGIF
jgi:hypothetical protein